LRNTMQTSRRNKASVESPMTLASKSGFCKPVRCKTKSVHSSCNVLNGILFGNRHPMSVQTILQQ
jgi:hypothetical protein